jgi:single-strand DNA-binding protein
MNKIILVGRLATDPELKYLPSGTPVTEFRMAVDRGFKNQAGEKETDFFTVKVWREQAENVANYLSKGAMAAVDGRMEMRQWVAPDGTKRTSPEVNASRVEFLPGGTRGHEGEGQAEGEEPQPYGGGGARSTQAPPRSAPQAAAPAAGQSEPDFGDPFADQ